MKRTVEEGSQQPSQQQSKRRKVDKINAVKKPFIRNDDNDPSIYTNMECKHVKIGKYVYTVKTIENEYAEQYNIDPQNAIGLTLDQYDNVAEYILNKKLSVTNFTETVCDIELLTIQLTTTNTFSIFVKVDNMIKIVKELLKDHIVQVGQSFKTVVDGMLMTLTVFDMNNTGYGKITSKTDIDFESLRSHINIYQNCIPIGNKSVKVTINNCVDIHDHTIVNSSKTYEQVDRFPLIISNDILRNNVNEAFKKQFADNSSVTSKHDGYEFSFTIKILNPDKNTKYKNIYELKNDTNPIQIVSNVSHVVITEDTDDATKIYFDLEKSINSKYVASDLIVCQEQLVEYIRKNIKKVVTDQKIKIMHNGKEIIMRVDYAEPYHTIKTLYKIDSYTKIVFNNEKGSDFIVTNNSIPYNLSTITLEIDDSTGSLKGLFSFLFDGDDDDEDTKILSSKKLTKVVRKVFPKKTAIEHRVSIPYKNSKFTATVKEMEFVDKHIMDKKRYTDYGLITDNTEIKFEISKDNKSLVIDNDEGGDIIKNPIEELEKDMGGVTDQIKKVIRTLCLSRGKLKKEFQDRKLKAAKGIILYGGPGTGKTLLARNLGKLLGCTEKNQRFRLMNGPDIFNKYVGQSEKNVRQIFAPAKEAWRKYGINAPTYIIAIDEIDAMLPFRTSSENDPVRNKVVNQFIGEMDGLEQFNNLIIIGLTNKLELLDPAVIRSGRFSIHIKFDLPDNKGRLKIFDIYTKTLKELNRLDTKIDFNKFIESTKDFSGADIEEVCNIASTLSLDRVDKMDLEEITDNILKEYSVVTEKDFIQAIKEVNETKKKDVEKNTSAHMYI